MVFICQVVIILHRIMIIILNREFGFKTCRQGIHGAFQFHYRSKWEHLNQQKCYAHHVSVLTILWRRWADVIRWTAVDESVCQEAGVEYNQFYGDYYHTSQC